MILLVETDVQKTVTPLHRLFFWFEGHICSKYAKNRGFVAPMRGCTYKMTIFYLWIGFVEVENTDMPLYICSTNNLFVLTDAKKDAKISL